MAKRVYQDHWRIVVAPRRPFVLSPDDARRHEQMVRRCRAIAEQIERHVDDVDHVKVESDTLAECESCGAVWTEEGATYNGGCCDADAQAAPAEAPPPPALAGGTVTACRLVGQTKGLDAAALDREARAVCGRALAELSEAEARTLLAHIQRV